MESTNLDRTLDKLKELKRSAKSDIVRDNLQMKIDILTRKKKRT